MASISDYLKNILAARYGKDVRQSIHDAIQQCYYDGKAGSIDLEARQSIEDLDNNKLDKTGDSASNTVTFTSGDSTSPTGWADIVAVASGETHASLFRKFSLAVKNLRYLYKMLGSTDISAIGDGTVTGVLSFLKSSIDTTNSNLDNIELVGTSVTIAELCTRTSANKKKVFRYTFTTDYCTDYPQKLIDLGAYYQPVVEIYKYGSRCDIKVLTPINASGKPVEINGYYTASKFIWGDVK